MKLASFAANIKKERTRHSCGQRPQTQPFKGSYFCPCNHQPVYLRVCYMALGLGVTLCLMNFVWITASQLFRRNIVLMIIYIRQRKFPLNRPQVTFW